MGDGLIKGRGGGANATTGDGTYQGGQQVEVNGLGKNPCGRHTITCGRGLWDGCKGWGQKGREMYCTERERT